MNRSQTCLDQLQQMLVLGCNEAHYYLYNNFSQIVQELRSSATSTILQKYAIKYGWTQLQYICSKAKSRMNIVSVNDFQNAESNEEENQNIMINQPQKQIKNKLIKKQNKDQLKEELVRIPFKLTNQITGQSVNINRFLSTIFEQLPKQSSNKCKNEQLWKVSNEHKLVLLLKFKYSDIINTMNLAPVQILKRLNNGFYHNEQEFSLDLKQLRKQIIQVYPNSIIGKDIVSFIDELI